MCAPDIPAPPDPVATVNAQTGSNKETAIANAALNRINQYTPYGSSEYQISGAAPDGTPTYTQRVNLSPEQQSLYDKYTTGQNRLGDIALGMQGQVSNSYTNPINAAGLPSLASGTGTPQFNPQNYADASRQAQDAAYAKNTTYLDPQFERSGKMLENQLANQGITRGSEAWRDANDQFSRQRQSAYDDARNSAIAQGNQRQDALFGQGLQTNQNQFSQALSNAQLQNLARQSGFEQLFALRNQPLNEYNALMTGAQVQNPNFSTVPGVQRANTDVAGIYNQGYQNQLGRAQMQQEGINNLFSLGGSLGAAAILSDRRLKRNIERAGELASGIPIYDFTYIWDDDSVRYRGVMADEIAPIYPDAVHYDENGFASVDYGRIW